MRDVVCNLNNRNLSKSMTTNFDSTIWQDVYHAMTPVGEMAYIKVTGYTDDPKGSGLDLAYPVCCQ